MNIDEALETHLSWRLEFRYAISARLNLDQNLISDPDYCSFGKWLNSKSGTAFAETTSYKNCLHNHAAFHAAAAIVVAQINAENFDEAEDMLSTDTEYSLAADELVRSIAELKSDLAQECARDACQGQVQEAK